MEENALPESMGNIFAMYSLLVYNYSAELLTFATLISLYLIILNPGENLGEFFWFGLQFFIAELISMLGV